MKSFRDIRVIPVVLIAILGLAVLKVAGLVIDGGYVFDYQPRLRPSDVLGAGHFQLSEPARPIPPTSPVRFTRSPRKEEAAKAGRSRRKRRSPDGVVVYPEQTQPVSPSERAILERLQSRRQELEARAREIDIRESLLKAAEKRIESRVEELKAVESRITDGDRAEKRGRCRALQGHHHHV